MQRASFLKALILGLGLVGCEQKAPEPLVLFDFEKFADSTPEELNRLDEGPQSTERISPDNSRATTINTGARAMIQTANQDYYAVYQGTGSQSFFLRRYLSHLELDTTFGTRGITGITGTGLGLDPRTVSVTTAGEVYVVGKVLRNNRWDTFVSRFLSNGTLTTGIGTSTINLSGGSEFLHGTIIDNRSRLIGSGYAVFGGRSAGFLFRLTSSGAFDTTFATVGYRLYTQSLGQNIFYEVSIDGNSRILTAGVAGSGQQGQATLWRVNTNGDLDTSFSTNGQRTIALGIQSLGYSARATAAGALYLSANYTENVSSRVPAIIRFLSDGTIDTSFATTGIYFTSVDMTYSPLWYVPMALSTEGKIGFAASANVLRLSSNGSLDSGFPRLITNYASPTSVFFDARGGEWAVFPLGTTAPHAEGYLVAYPYRGFNAGGGSNPLGAPGKLDLGFFASTHPGTTDTLILHNLGFATIGSLAEDGTEALASPFGFAGGTYPGTGGDCGATLGIGTSCSVVIAMQTNGSAAQDLLVFNYAAGGQNRQLSVPVLARSTPLLITSFPAYTLQGNDYCNFTTELTFQVTNTSNSPISGLVSSGSETGGTGFVSGPGITCSTIPALGSCYAYVTKNTYPEGSPTDQARLQMISTSGVGITLKLIASSWSGNNCDEDGDGFTPGTGDCSDSNPLIYPGQSENPCTAYDDNCDGLINNNGTDVDGDGYFAQCNDCNDANALINPGRLESACNGIDDNCNGTVDEGSADADNDSDSFNGCDDCDDSNSSIYPGATEDPCNGKDDDCDLTADEGYVDSDGDGYASLCGDCNDGNASIHPGAFESLCNQQDDDCDGQIDEGMIDIDGDGYSTGCGDCDDNNSLLNPGAHEFCDGLDNDCNGLVDDACSRLPR